jgi:hypothetical protein
MRGRKKRFYMPKFDYMKVLMFVILFQVSFICKAQLYRDKNAVFIELIGNAETLLSINYSRLIIFKKYEYVTMDIRNGFSLGKNLFDSSRVFIFPTEFCVLFGGEKHQLEIGTGLNQYVGTSNFESPLIPDVYKTNYQYSFVFRGGYRFTSYDERLLVRIAPLWFVGPEQPGSKKMFTHWNVGLSLGFTF